MADNLILERVGWMTGGLIVGTGSSVASTALDDQNEGIAAAFEIYEDATITHVGFRCAAKTGTPGDDIYTCGIQGMSTGGVPDGTYLGGGSPASQTFPNATYPAAGFGTGTYHWIALANSIALQAGTQYQLVIQHTGATDASNLLTLTRGSNQMNQPGFPYPATASSAGTWTKDTANYPLYWGVKSASKSYLLPTVTVQNVLACGSTTETGFTFTMPSGYGGNTKGLRGIRFCSGTSGPAGAGTYTLTLYSGALAASPTILQQKLNQDSDFTNATASRVFELLFSEDTLSALASGTKYGVGLSHSGVGGWSWQYQTVQDAGDATAYPYGGFARMSRTLTSYPPSGDDTNAFTETATGMIVAELIFGEVTPPSGGSGGMLSSNLQANMM